MLLHDALSNGPRSSLHFESISKGFDASRLRQARRLAMLTKQSLAQEVGLSPAMIGQYESGMSKPGPDLIPKLARSLNVPPEFFRVGRPQAALETGDAFFRSLRSTSAKQRAKAVSFTEQLWELANAIEKRVQLPRVDLPGFAGGGHLPESTPTDPAQAARLLRATWKLGDGPLAHLVRTIEAHGVIVMLVPLAEEEIARIDAFSTVCLPRPVMVLSPDRGNDVYRHRFSAAHELGHLILHGEEHTPGDPALERAADEFAYELLLPAATMANLLPRRLNFALLEQISNTWGASIKDLIYRSRVLGLLSEATARRGYIQLAQLDVRNRLIHEFPGEVPGLLKQATDLAETQGLTIPKLAAELAWKSSRVQLFLGETDSRPILKLVE